MHYFAPLFTFSYWFNLTPAPMVRPLFIGLGIVLALILAAGVALKVFASRVRANPPLHRLLSRIGRALLTLAVVGFALYFFGYEQIYVFGSRFWWMLWLMGAIVWAVFIVRYRLAAYPHEQVALAERLAREKYLPR